MKDRDVVHVEPPLEWTLDAGQHRGNSRVEAREKPPWTAECSRTLARPPGEHPDGSGLCVESIQNRISGRTVESEQHVRATLTFR